MPLHEALKPRLGTGRTSSEGWTRAWGSSREREFFIDNLLVRIHFIIVMIRRTGLAPWEFEALNPEHRTYEFRGMDEGMGFLDSLLSMRYLLLPPG